MAQKENHYRQRIEELQEQLCHKKVSSIIVHQVLSVVDPTFPMVQGHRPRWGQLEEAALRKKIVSKQKNRDALSTDVILQCLSQKWCGYLSKPNFVGYVSPR